MSAPPSARAALAAALCLAAAARLLFFSAAFPLFDNEDEPSHYATVLAFGEGRRPSGDRIGPGAAAEIAAYGSPEYVLLPQEVGARSFTPYWTAPDPMRASVEKVSGAVERQANGEVMQPPLYYAAAAAWRGLGRSLGLRGPRLIYWLRALNALLYALFMVVAYAAGLRFFPGRSDLTFSLLLLLAALPQQILYSIDNDVLSPLAFGACLLAWFDLRERPQAAWPRYAWIGLLTAACLLTKLTNAAILLAAAAVLYSAAGKRGGPALLGAAVLAFALPVGVWCLRERWKFGSALGVALKLKQMGWTPKPWSRFLDSPLFSIRGELFFLSELAARFWRGECLWFNQPMTTALDGFYAVSSPLLLAAALWPRRGPADARTFPRWTSLACVAGSVLLLAYWSVAYDFGASAAYPSREFPYVVSGRLILGALLPFFLLYVEGMDRTFEALDLPRGAAAFSAALALCMTLSWSEACRPVLRSPFNLFSMPAQVPAPPSSGASAP